MAKAKQRRLNIDGLIKIKRFFEAIVSVGVPSVVWGGNNFMVPPSRCWLVWNKPTFPTMSDVELAWTNLDAIAKRFDSPRVHQADGVKLHPTQKPIRLIEWCLSILKTPGSVYDPFLGSGTTLIAAEQLGRRCYGMEIEPIYCDVAVKRWQKFTGGKAKRAR